MKARYITHSAKTLTDEGLRNCSAKLLPKGTVLVSFKLSIGKVAIAGRDLYTNEAIAGLTPKDWRVLPEYLYHLLPRLNLTSYMQPATKGMTLNKKIISAIKIPLPSIPEQQRIVTKMNELDANMAELNDRLVDIAQEADDFMVSQIFK